MTYRINALSSEQEAEVMVAADNASPYDRRLQHDSGPGCDSCGTCIGCDGCADADNPVDLDRGDCESCGACGPCIAECAALRTAEDTGASSRPKGRGER